MCLAQGHNTVPQVKLWTTELLLRPNCLQMLSTEDPSRQGINLLLTKCNLTCKMIQYSLYGPLDESQVRKFTSKVVYSVQQDHPLLFKQALQTGK